MKFSTGDLVKLVGSDGETPLSKFPPGLVIRSYMGHPLDLESRKEARLVYDLLFSGIVERCVDEEWLVPV